MFSSRFPIIAELILTSGLVIIVASCFTPLGQSLHLAFLLCRPYVPRVRLVLGRLGLG
jgi:hypothetical protein